MKLWILNHVALKPNEKGITRHYDLAKYMVKDGHSVTIFASSFLAYLFQWRDPSRKNYAENVNGVDFEWVWTLPYKGNGPKRLLNMMSYFFTAIKRGINHKEKPDAIIGSSVHLFACLAAYVLSKLKRSRYIVEIRDLWPKTLIDFGSMSKYHPVAIMFGIIEKFVYKKAEKIIVTLPGAHKYITSLGIPMEKIVYIPNGIDFQRLEDINTPSSLMDEMKEIRKTYSKVTMYVGAHGVANSLPTVIESNQYLGRKDTAYIFVGEGPEREKLIEKAKQFDNIYFFDAIPKGEVQSTLRLADVLMVSMLDTKLYQYGISLNKLNDYLLSGKPILFAGSVYNDIVTDSGAGKTVPPEDPVAFAQGLNNLLELTDEEKEAISKRGYQFLDENHNIEKLSKRFLNVCQHTKSQNEKVRS